MKKILSVVFAVVISTGLFATKGLVITQKYTDATAKGAAITMTWYVTETQCKMKMSYADGDVNSNTYFIPDIAGAKLLTYSDGVAPGGGERKFYSVPVQGIKPAIEVSRVSVNQTGETKTIGGMLCQKVIIKTNRTTTEMWITQDFKADFYKFYPFFQSSYELLGLNDQSLQGVPLESVTKDNGGTVISSLQLVTVTNSDLSAGDFTVPAEYRSADVSTAK
jgi:hypothetical protein